MAAQGPLSGHKVGNKYLLGNLLGQGGFGAVYQAEHLYLHRSQAIKVLIEQHFHQHIFRERFLREAETLAKLEHHNIVPVHDFWTESSGAYLVMPLIGGGTLQDLLREKSGFLDLTQIVSYLESICSALDYAHQQGVVHLDLKPLNLLIHQDGKLLLSDFGLAHWMKQGIVEGGSSLDFGTPHYMAPEHIQGRPERRSDLFSLGIILYQMLVKKLPFEGPRAEAIIMKIISEWPLPVQTFRPELPQATEEVMRRALAKRPEQRYQTANDLLSAFKAALVDVRGPLVLTHDPQHKSSFAEEPTQEDLINQLKDERKPQAVRQREYQEALKVYEQELAQNPTSYSAQCGRGQMLYYLKRYGEALLSYERAVRLDPKQAPGYYGKSTVLRHLKQYREAFVTYRHAFSSDPRSPDALYQDGVTCLQARRYEKALAAFEQVLQQNPADSQAYTGKGTAIYAKVVLEKVFRDTVLASEKTYMHLESSQTLITCDEALRLDPTNALAHCEKGIALYHLSCYEEALVAFDEAIRLKPDGYTHDEMLDFLFNGEEYRAYRDGWHQKGYTLLRLQRQEEAWPIFEKDLPQNYSFEQVFSLSKDSGSRFTQQCEEALSLYEEAIHFDPTDICAYLGKCHILLELGRHEEAQATREQVERIEEKVQLASPQLRKRPGARRLDDIVVESPIMEGIKRNGSVQRLAAYQNGLHSLRYHRAVNWEQQAARFDPQNTLAHTCTGFALYSLTHYKQALAAHEQALLLDLSLPRFRHCWQTPRSYCLSLVR